MRVFMRSDRESFVSDSLDFRRAVFEILIGTSSERFYDSLGKFRLSERRVAESQAALDVFKNAVAQLSTRPDTNSVFLGQLHLGTAGATRTLAAQQTKRTQNQCRGACARVRVDDAPEGPCVSGDRTRRDGAARANVANEGSRLLPWKASLSMRSSEFRRLSTHTRRCRSFRLTRARAACVA